MGLFSNLKDILFKDDLDEVDEMPVITKKEQEIPSRQIKREIAPKKEEIKKEEQKEVKPIEQPVSKPTPQPVQQQAQKPVPKSAIKTEATPTPFVPFDEDEFDFQMNKKPSREKQQPQKQVIRTTTSVKKTEYKDYSRYEVTKVEERKPFSPTPVISPVYGILDKNYKKDDVVERKRDKEDVDQVRKKAFGKIDTIPAFLEETIEEKEKQYEEIEKEQELKEVKTEKIKKKVDIDEMLLEGFSDFSPKHKNAKTEIPTLIEKIEIKDEPEENFEYLDEHTSALEILDQIEKELNHDNSAESVEEDLFKLIDSMYDRKG